MGKLPNRSLIVVCLIGSPCSVLGKTNALRPPVLDVCHGTSLQENESPCESIHLPSLLSLSVFRISIFGRLSPLTKQEVLERVTQLRNQCVDNHGKVVEQAADEMLLVTELRQLLARVEDYPELKADQHFLNLQQQLVNTEDRIQAARRFYNGNVRDYKNKCEQFPSNLVANLFGFQPESYFQVEPSVQSVPNLEF